MGRGKHSYRGVTYVASVPATPWRVTINNHGKTIDVGLYPTERGKWSLVS